MAACGNLRQFPCTDQQHQTQPPIIPFPLPSSNSEHALSRPTSRPAHHPAATMSTPAAPARASFVADPSTPANPATAPVAAMSPELEQTLTLLASHRSVLGYILLSRSQPVSIIRHSGVVFDGEQGRKYAHAIARIVESVRVGLEEVNHGEQDADDVRFMRIRTRRHEIMISPDDRYLLAVLHDPTVT